MNTIRRPDMDKTTASKSLKNRPTTLKLEYPDFSVALKNPEAALPLKMFVFGYDESLIRSIQKAASSYLRSKASNIAAKYLETHGMNESVSDIRDEGSNFLVIPGGTDQRPLKISKKIWQVLDEEENDSPVDFAQAVYETNMRLSKIGYPGTKSKEAIESFQKEQLEIEALTQKHLAAHN